MKCTFYQNIKGHEYIKLSELAKESYFKTSKGILLKGDTFEWMKRIPDESIDMILTDLPYGQTARNKWDTTLPFDQLWKAYDRIIKPNGAIVLFANGMFTANLMKSNEKLWKYNLVWDKVLPSGFLNSKKQPLRNHEDICVFYKKPPTYNPQMIAGDACHSRGKAVGKSQDEFSRNTNYGELKAVDTNGNLKYPKSILRFQKPHPSITVHPTQKPVEGLEWLINTYTKENEIVLDSTAGSCSTAVAAENVSRRWICIEQEEEYCDKGIERLRKYISG